MIRSLERVDDPAVAGVLARDLAAFLHQEAEARARLGEPCWRVRSAFLSAVETKSLGPLTETWRFRLPRNRARDLARPCRAGGDHDVQQQNKAAIGARVLSGKPKPSTRAGNGEGDPALRPLDVGGIGGVHHDAVAGGDERQDQHPHAVGEHARLIGGRRSAPSPPRRPRPLP